MLLFVLLCLACFLFLLLVCWNNKQKTTKRAQQRNGNIVLVLAMNSPPWKQNGSPFHSLSHWFVLLQFPWDQAFWFVFWRFGVLATDSVPAASSVTPDQCFFRPAYSSLSFCTQPPLVLPLLPLLPLLRTPSWYKWMWTWRAERRAPLSWRYTPPGLLWEWSGFEKLSRRM